MEKVICDNCNKSFLKKKSQILLSKKNFCSRECCQFDKRNGIEIECKKCGKKTYKKKRELENNVNFFCSKKCSVYWKNTNTYGENHPNWTGGKYSYKNILKRSQKSRFCKKCMLKDKDVLIVHHIDYNRKNNLASNLVWLCRNCHHLVHKYDVEQQHLKNILKND